MNNNTESQSKTNRGGELTNWLISELAFFIFLYYVQYLLGVGGSLWVSSLILWALLNLSIIFCPVIRKCRG